MFVSFKSSSLSTVRTSSFLFGSYRIPPDQFDLERRVRMNKEKIMFSMMDSRRKVFDNDSVGMRNKAPPTPDCQVFFQNKKCSEQGSSQFGSNHVAKYYERNYDPNQIQNQLGQC